MVRDSRSPRRSYHSDLPDSNARGSKSSRRDYDRDEKPPRSDDRRRNEDSSRRYGDSRDRRRDDRPQEEPRWGRRDEGDRRERDRRDRDDRDIRDRERDRDGARDRGGDRDRDRRRDNREDSSRRSASPRRPSRAPSAEGSRSKSPEDKAKPNFGASGLLAAATKTVKHADGTGTVLKYHEPPEARKPSVGWRLYVFKGKEQVELLHIHRQSAYLIGRDRLVADITIEHPSCSKQHAVVQFRQVHEKNEFGEAKSAVKPFIIDLESTNGTHVNGEQIPTSRYFELKLADVIKFGESQREYVLLSEDAA